MRLLVANLVVFAAMEMFDLKRQLVVQGDGVSWSVPHDMVKTVDGVEFVKLQPSRNYGFVKLVKGKQSTASDSLSNAKGYLTLQQLRSNFGLEASDAAASLFDVDEQQAKKKKKLAKKHAKDEVTVLPIQLDGVIVKILSAAHPAESVWVEASSLSISTAIDFIRRNGLEVEEAAAEVAALAPGEFKMGGGRVATKVDGRLKYVKKN